MPRAILASVAGALVVVRRAPVPWRHARVRWSFVSRVHWKRVMSPERGVHGPLLSPQVWCRGAMHVVAVVRLLTPSPAAAHCRRLLCVLAVSRCTCICFPTQCTAAHRCGRGSGARRHPVGAGLSVSLGTDGGGRRRCGGAVSCARLTHVAARLRAPLGSTGSVDERSRGASITLPQHRIDAILLVLLVGLARQVELQ